MSLASRVHHRFSVDEYDEMSACGILDENDRVELIRGEIVDKITIGDRHAACVKRLNAMFQALSQGRWIVSLQDPVAFEDSKPEPDLALLQPRGDFYADSTPQASDILLVIEVADTSLDFDRDVKLPLYAEAGVAEYWIVNLTDSCVEVHRGPRSDGTYADSQTVAKGGTVSFQGLDLSVDRLF
ncbi:MAG: Uma2 family endonuclease [Planctomycetota bacterium]